jgi:TonB family protein
MRGYLGMRIPPPVIFMSAVLSLIAILSSFASQNPAQPAPQAPATQYANSIQGLRQEIQDAVQLAKNGDQPRLLELTSSMVLPNSDDWFNKIFGRDYGPTYAESYAKDRENLRLILANTFLGLVREGFTDFDVYRFIGNCDEHVYTDEFDVLVARYQMEALSVIRFRNGTKAKTLRYFAYVGDGFRFLGNLRAPMIARQDTQLNTPPASQSNAVPTRIPVPGDVEKSKIINKVQPVYPQDAQQNGIQGTVRIHAIISREGKVSEMNLVSGPCILAEAAFKAVGQWRFTPTTLNKIPVEVECVLDVKFVIDN